MEEQKNKQQGEQGNKKEQEAKNQAQGTESQKTKKDEKLAQKQEQPLKYHGVPEEESEESRHGGLKGGENFGRNMGCGG